jgi:putative endonuclease
VPDVAHEQTLRAVAARTPSRHAPDPRRALGRRGEEIAAAHMERLGFRVLERNVRTRSGEIDLIAFDGRTLVFVEVKTARARRGGSDASGAVPPHGWLGRRQRVRLRRLAVAWLSEARRARPTAATIRFDAVGVIIDSRQRLVRLDHLTAAW